MTAPDPRRNPIPRSAPPPAWPIRRYQIASVVLVALLVGGLGVWSVQARLAGAVIAQGHVEVESSRQVVQHLDGGIVATIHVDDGDLVKAGQVLIELDSSVLRAEKAKIENELFELMARRGRLVAEETGAAAPDFDERLIAAARESPNIRAIMRGQETLFFARKRKGAKETARLNEQKRQIRQQIEGVEFQLQALNEQISFNAEEIRLKEDLFNKGYARRSELMSLRNRAAELTGLMGEYRARTGELGARLTELDIELAQLGSNDQEEAVTTLRDLQYREFDLVEERAVLENKLDRLRVRAPASGTVYAMQVHTPGSVIRPAEAVLHVVPDTSRLVVAARVDVRDIDQIRLGQTADVVFSAFDTRDTPELVGMVRNISADSFQDEATGLRFYTAEIEVEDEEMARLGDRRVIPGMAADVFFQTGERSPMSYVTGPILHYLDRSMRE